MRQRIFHRKIVANSCKKPWKRQAYRWIEDWKWRRWLQLSAATNECTNRNSTGRCWSPNWQKWKSGCIHGQMWKMWQTVSQPPRIAGNFLGNRWIRTHWTWFPFSFKQTHEAQMHKKRSFECTICHEVFMRKKLFEVKEMDVRYIPTNFPGLNECVSTVGL